MDSFKGGRSSLFIPVSKAYGGWISFLEALQNFCSLKFVRPSPCDPVKVIPPPLPPLSSSFAKIVKHKPSVEGRGELVVEKGLFFASSCVLIVKEFPDS